MKTLLKLVLAVVGVFSLFVLGYGWRNFQRGEGLPSSAVEALFGITPTNNGFSATEVYRKTFKKISTEFYRKVDLQELKYAGVDGLMASLGDPHTAFLDPKTSTEFHLETEGHFVGVGAKLSPDPLGAKVVNVFETGPAFKAGLKAGDVITAVDGQSASGRQIDAVVKRIRGKEGTMVKLVVIRPATPKPITLVIRRAQVTTPTVDTKVLPDKIGYMAISTFAEPTTQQLDDGIAKLESAGIRGLVIDLRENPGGRLDTAVDMLARFVEDKVVIKTKMRGGMVDQYKTPQGMVHNFRYPIVVLINENSASAAEIFAGVLRDYRLATLVGEHSYGKASVQEVRQFTDGAGAKITVARYFLPGGEDIGRRVDEDGQYLSGGLEPDVEVEWNYDASSLLGDLKTDNQLQKAVEVVKAKM